MNYTYLKEFNLSASIFCHVKAGLHPIIIFKWQIQGLNAAVKAFLNPFVPFMNLL